MSDDTSSIPQSEHSDKTETIPTSEPVMDENKLIDEDIMIEDIISSTQKVKLDSGSNELEKEGNSLCTIMEQPSLEEMKKSIFSTNIMPNTNTIEEKNKTGNYVLELNNNMTNMSNPIINKSANNQNYKPLIFKR